MSLSDKLKSFLQQKEIENMKTGEEILTEKEKRNEN